MKFSRFVLVSTSALALFACQGSATPQDDMNSSSSSAAAAFTGTHTEIDMTQSSISFIGNSPIISHPGEFEEFEATFTPDATDPSDVEGASLSVTIDLTSAKTNSTGVDGHLQRDDFFDTAVHPEATFTSTSITSKGGNAYTIAGDLTIKGETHPISVDATITDEGINASFDIVRRDFGVGNDSYGNKILDAEVPVTVELAFN